MRMYVCFYLDGMRGTIGSFGGRIWRGIAIDNSEDETTDASICFDVIEVDSSFSHLYIIFHHDLYLRK